MTVALQDILHEPHEHALPPQWIEPDLVILDDVIGPMALRDLAATFGPRAPVAHADRLRIVSTIDRETALPDRVRADDLLEAFAETHGVAFARESAACDDGCALPIDGRPGQLVISPRRGDPEIAVRGGVTVRAQAADLATVLATGRAWLRRPPVQRVSLEGTLSDGVTPHDVAIALRPQIHEGIWLVLDGLPADDLESRRMLAGLLLAESRAAAVLCVNESRPGGLTLDLSGLVAGLGEGDECSASVADHEPIEVDRVYIGSCATGSVADLRLAAAVLNGSKVVIPTVIAPSSDREIELLQSERIQPSDPSSPTLADVFQNAGCDLGMPGCAGCVNALADMFNENRRSDALTVVATAVANVTTRRIARVLTASPITAAQVAVSGRVGRGLPVAR